MTVDVKIECHIQIKAPKHWYSATPPPPPKKKNEKIQSYAIIILSITLINNLQIAELMISIYIHDSIK